MEIVIVLFFFIAFSADGALYEECGVVTPTGAKDLMAAGGNSAQRGEVPWHSAIYSKSTTPYQLICGGSLVSNNIIISAAHCFWKNGKTAAAANYAVGVGQLQRFWNSISTKEMNALQRSDVKEIHLPVFFQGTEANNQADIAAVVLTTKLKCTATVRPVCLDFDYNFEKTQLKPGNKGKVAGWGFTSADGESEQDLQVLELPYVDTTTCLNQTPYSFHPYVTVDKFCAGYINASRSVCQGDNGGGLVFPESDKLPIRYYLRGVVSSAPVGNNRCSVNDYSVYTSLLMHEHFIKDIWRNNTNDNETFCVLEPREHQRQGCGWSYPRGGLNNGTSGAEVQYGEFPWTCAVLESMSVTDATGRVTTRDVFVRGGALIHPAVVLIYGYSLDTGARYRVRAGVGSGASTAGGRRAQVRDVETVETLAATERDSCQREMIRTGRAWEGYTLDDEFSCVSAGRERAVNGTMCRDMDRQSSPVSCPIESEHDRYMLAGFVWISYNCASAPLWTYADLTRYRTRIDAVVTAKGYHTTTYSVY